MLFGPKYRPGELVSSYISRYVKDPLGSETNPASSALEILNENSNATSGVYWIKWNGSDPIKVWCEMSLAGGGWMMILNYVHLGGTNPNLLVRTDSLPLMGSEYTLGVDESSSTGSDGTWGHASNAMANLNNWSEYMFYGKTSGHNRIIHFRGNNTNIVSYMKTGSGAMVPHYADSTTNFNETLRVNSSIPLFVNNDRNGFSNQGNLAMTEFPIYGESTIGNPRAHWGIKGLGSRWEVDDFSGDSSLSTIHRVWVR